jgi:hypothetical protein
MSAFFSSGLIQTFAKICSSSHFVFLIFSKVIGVPEPIDQNFTEQVPNHLSTKDSFI